MKRIKLKKRRNKLRFKRKLVLTSTLVLLFVLGIGYSVLSVNLNILGNITVRKTYGNTLYEVLEKEAAIGTYAKEYTGAHHDSFTEEPTKKIYHWYAPSDTSGIPIAEAITEKNNVLFAKHCWQMVRTTDTGGVKMIYNGEAENGQCLNTRGNHEGYDSASTATMSPTYYYGTEYIYDKVNNNYTLSGTVTTGTIKIGQYTCRSTSSSGTCSTLYLVYGLVDNTTYTVLYLKGNTYTYSQYGKLPYSKSSGSPAYVGYMNNIIYPTKMISSYVNLNNTTVYIRNVPYYSDTIDYGNITANKYTLINAQPTSTLDDYSQLIGKYVSYSTTNDQVFYVVSNDDITVRSHNLKDGDLNVTMTVGDSYTDNGNGTYTLNNPSVLTYADWYSSYSNYNNKYFCLGTGSTCNNIGHFTYVTHEYYNYYSSQGLAKYSEGINYNNNTYTLTGDIKEIWDFGLSTNRDLLSTHHYTCLNNSTSCSNVKYVHWYESGRTYSIELNDVSNINDALINMLNADDVNQNDSIMKLGIDSWYKHYMTNYTSNLEDIVFCNNRNIGAKGGWNPNGGSITTSLHFNPSKNGLGCENTIDKFSISNDKARLTYPVGILSSIDKDLMSSGRILSSPSEYWTASPAKFDYNCSYGYTILESGGYRTASTTNPNGVRPAISLRPGTEYISGTGSKADPYVVNTFKDDDWATIVNNVRNGNTANYQVGDTKEVDMGSLGTHTLRIANKSTPNECNNSDFSETSCGFVLEFADIIERRKMNSTSTNVGGWPVTEMRTYVNNDIYNALPSDLKNGIIDTRVISGHGSSDSNNFTSTEKLYLQSVKELYDLNLYDAAANNTRQLDYYSNMGVHSADIRVARKYNTNDEIYWLRSANSTSTSSYYAIDSSGMWESDGPTIILGVSPAFRIG